MYAIALLLLVPAADWRRPCIAASLSDLNRFAYSVEECAYQKGRYEALAERLEKRAEEATRREAPVWLARVKAARDAAECWELLRAARAYAGSQGEYQDASAESFLSDLLWRLGEADYLAGRMPERYPPGWRFPGEDAVEPVVAERNGMGWWFAK